MEALIYHDYKYAQNTCASLTIILIVWFNIDVCLILIINVGDLSLVKYLLYNIYINISIAEKKGRLWKYLMDFFLSYLNEMICTPAPRNSKILSIVACCSHGYIFPVCHLGRKITSTTDTQVAPFLPDTSFLRGEVGWWSWFEPAIESSDKHIIYFINPLFIYYWEYGLLDYYNLLYLQLY